PPAPPPRALAQPGRASGPSPTPASRAIRSAARRAAINLRSAYLASQSRLRAMGGATRRPHIYAAASSGRMSASAALGVLVEPPQPVARLSGRRGYRALLHGGYVDAVKVRPREAADQAAARAFLARHDSLWAARLG